MSARFGCLRCSHAVQLSGADAVRAGPGLLHATSVVRCIRASFPCSLFAELCLWRVACVSLNVLAFRGVSRGQDKLPCWLQEELR